MVESKTEAFVKMFKKVVEEGGGELTYSKFEETPFHRLDLKNSNVYINGFAFEDWKELSFRLMGISLEVCRSDLPPLYIYLDEIINFNITVFKNGKSYVIYYLEDSKLSWQMKVYEDGKIVEEAEG